MHELVKFSSPLYAWFFSAAAERRVRVFLLVTAAVLFVTQIVLYGISVVWPALPAGRFIPHNFLATINPPLTIILVYEVYLLVTATAHSIIQFISKQFEVVSLIILRGIFKDLSHISTTQEISLNDPLLHTIGIAMIGSLILYLLIEVFSRFKERFATSDLHEEPLGMRRWKQALALVLGTIFLCITMYHGGRWLVGVEQSLELQYFKQIFSVLVVFDIALLLLSLRYFQSYEMLYEYSAFIAASVLVLLALPQTVVVQLAMVLSALVFCIVTVRLHGFTRNGTRA